MHRRWRKSAWASVAFWHEERRVACVVHGDDFIFSGADKDLTWVEQLMQEWFEVKVRARIGPDESDDKEISILGRRVRWEHWGISYRADPKHRAIVLERFGLGDGSKGLAANGKQEEPDEDDEELQGAEVREFRTTAARLNFMAQDCPDVQFATKEICREMAGPRRSSWMRVKRLARCLGRRPSSGSGGCMKSRAWISSRTAIGQAVVEHGEGPALPEDVECDSGADRLEQRRGGILLHG